MNTEIILNRSNIRYPRSMDGRTALGAENLSLTESVDGGVASARTKPRYVVMLATGDSDGGKRATLAFATACVAMSMELDTQVFLIGDGSHWAYEGCCEPVAHTGFPALKDLVESFMEMGGQIYICSACDQACTIEMAADGRFKRRRVGIQPRGLAAVLDHTVGGTTVTF